MMHLKTILVNSATIQSLYASRKWIQHSLPQRGVILHNKKLGKMFPFVQPDFFSNIPGLSSLVPILAVAAVLPVSSIFFRALDCTYVSQGDVTNMRNGVLFFEQRGVNMTLLQLPPETGPGFSLVDHCRGLGINETALLPATWQSCDTSAYTTPCPIQFLSGLPDQVLGCCPVTECPLDKRPPKSTFSDATPLFLWHFYAFQNM